MNRKQLEKLSDSELRAALAQFRISRGMKMRQMAALLGKSIGAYSASETPGKRLTPSHREAIMKVLENEDIESVEKGDVRAVRIIDSAMAPLSKKERGRVVKFLVEKFTE